MGDPRAVAFFSVKVPRDEPGPWLGRALRDERDPSTTPFANADNRELWTLLQQRTADTIAMEIPELKLDRTAGEFTRVTRLHGSLNSAADRRVRYELLPGPGGEPTRYSLEELAGFYGLRPPARRRPLDEPEEDRLDVELEAHRRREDERDEERRRRQASRVGVDPRLSELGRQGHGCRRRGTLERSYRCPCPVLSEVQGE
jgi:hypothetical protein